MAAVVWGELDPSNAEAGVLRTLMCAQAPQYRDGREPPSFAAFLEHVGGPELRRRRACRRPRDEPMPIAEGLAVLLARMRPAT